MKMVKKQESNWTRAVRQFFSTTTLHGFKYLYSEFYMDRIGWLICCCTSTCCAGLLCTVLWERFLDVPAVLELLDLQSEEAAYQYMPLTAVCPPVEPTIAILVDKLTSNSTIKEQARKSLTQVLSAQPTSLQHLQQLEMLLSGKNILLTEFVFNHQPSCEQYILRCRWQYMMVPCEDLFTKELTPWGICCVMRPLQVLNAIVQRRTTISTKGLDLTLQCSDEPTQGCRYISTFEFEEIEEPTVVLPGYNYFAQLYFTSVPQNSIEELVGKACNPNKDYDKADCLARCAEKLCGCTNPLRPKNKTIGNRARPCNMVELECLWVHQNNSLCNCLPCCNKVTTSLTLESGRMEVLDAALDPIYSNLNDSSTVIHVTVYMGLSRIFTMRPTETWLSLLSSLGGVFNMFLGVGLFSALEILFLMFIKLPIAFMNSSEITNPDPPLSRY